MLDTQIMKRPVSDEQVRALEKAVLLLEGHEAPLPPLLMQVHHEVQGADLSDTVVVEFGELNQGKYFIEFARSLASFFNKPLRLP